MVLSQFKRLVVVILAGGFIFSACENDPSEVESYRKSTKEIEEGKDIKATFSQSGKLKAILESPLMYRIKGDTIKTEFPESVFVTFYDTSGQKESIVRADYAEYLEVFRKVYMRDSVVVYTIKGDTLFAQDMWWDQDQELFYSTNPVRIHTPSQKLRGTGVRAKSDFSKYTIENPVGDVAIPEDIETN
ncbi:MAG: LPS export ABC transporter periplasmic protein LptC [Chitinophagaceae bacterium]|nr:LPS export ABC transporter periplasmic protein LptC [Chitinophagaceae bacterium]